METAETTPLTPEILIDSDLYRARVLPADEWATRREELYQYPFLPNPDLSKLVVVEEKLTGRIVASWFAGNQVCLEGLYITPDARPSIAVPRLLLSAMVQLLQTLQIPGALTLAEDASILALARRAGFEPIPGTLLRVTLPPKE